MNTVNKHSSSLFQSNKKTSWRLVFCSETQKLESFVILPAASLRKACSFLVLLKQVDETLKTLQI